MLSSSGHYAGIETRKWYFMH